MTEQAKDQTVSNPAEAVVSGELCKGWYFVEIQNPIPEDNEVISFNDWVEYTDDGWDMVGLEKFKIGKVIKAESNSC
jgi:hypothetical protein